MQTITYQQLKEKLERNIPVINVLSEEAFREGHIPGSINLPHEKPDFARQVEETIGGKDKPVIVYCASYSCDASKRAALKLDQAGFTAVMAYEGGTKEWREKNPALAA